MSLSIFANEDFFRQINTFNLAAALNNLSGNIETCKTDKKWEKANMMDWICNSLLRENERVLIEFRRRDKSARQM